MLARRRGSRIRSPGSTAPWLDDIVDYLTYAFAPVVLLWTTGSLPGGAVGWVVAALPLLASSYQFCRVDAKTDDHSSSGFPSYWNVVAFYVVVLDLVPAVVATLLSRLLGAGLRAGALPLPAGRRPARPEPAADGGLAGHLRRPAGAGARPAPVVVALSPGLPRYYVAVSLWLTARAARRRRGERPATG
jgi:phosphatidylcholine synthase